MSVRYRPFFLVVAVCFALLGFVDLVHARFQNGAHLCQGQVSTVQGQNTLSCVGTCPDDNGVSGSCTEILKWWTDPVTQIQHLLIFCGCQYDFNGNQWVIYDPGGGPSGIYCDAAEDSPVGGGWPVTASCVGTCLDPEVDCEEQTIAVWDDGNGGQGRRWKCDCN